MDFAFNLFILSQLILRLDEENLPQGNNINNMPKNSRLCEPINSIEICLKEKGFLQTIASHTIIQRIKS